MDVPRLLCNSNFCRLCAEDNKNSSNLFSAAENEQDLSHLVNKYLPLKVERDGKFPIVICPGCYIQLEATKQFLDLIIEGQNKLRALFRQQQDTLRRQEKQRQQLESALKNVSPNSSVDTFTIASDENGEKFLIKILSDGPLFPPEHELSLRAEGLEKPKRKRGRPPKPPPPTDEELKVINDEKNSKEAEEEDEFDVDGKRRRKIKVPFRFQEAVKGKELDRIFKEEGVIDEDSVSEEDTVIEIPSPGRNGDEIIGHLQSKEGDDLGELVINKRTNKIRIKAKDGVIGPEKQKKYECNICRREFRHYGRFEIHKTFHKIEKYGCANCDLKVSTKTELENHQIEVGHTGITFIERLNNYGEVALPQLSSSTDENEEININKNQRVELVESKFNCKLCDKKFSSKQNFEVHHKAVHENQRPYQCDKCEKSYSYFNSLKCHMIQHYDKSEKSYNCDICNKEFNHPSSLVYHREAEHNNGRRFVCNKCNKVFKHKQLLQRHQLVHTDARPHTCKTCNGTFKTRANLVNHMPIHTGEKKHYCKQCGQSFAHKTSLTLHERWHSGQKPYECDVCMKTFSQKGNLAEHKRIHTGEKPYCCDHCGRKFTTSSQFKLHVKRHTGEKPWRCEYCAKTFLHKDTWKCHTRRHRNERPYECSQCFRGFTEQWALKKHERLHTGLKPYICDICQKSFADCSNLTKHKKIHTNLRISKDTKPRNVKILSADDQGQSEDNQVIYFTYQDSNSNDSRLQTYVQFTDTMSNDETLEDESFLTSLQDPLGDYEEVVDENGSVLSLTTVDGQQIKVLATTKDERCIQGLMPNGTLIPIVIPDEKRVEKALDEKLHIPTSHNENEEDLLENNMQYLNTDSNKIDNSIQFLTQDGQNICLLTTYNLDESINPQCLAMT